MSVYVSLDEYSQVPVGMLECLFCLFIHITLLYLACTSLLPSVRSSCLWRSVVGPFLIGRLADASGGSYAVPMAALAAMDLVAAGLLIGEHTHA